MRSVVRFWFVLFFIPSLFAGCSDEPSNEFQQMVGKSADELKTHQGVRLAKLTEQVNARAGVLPLRPMQVLRIDVPDTGPQYVVVFGAAVVIIPGEARVSLVLLSTGGIDLGSWSFSAGWRLELKSAESVFDPELGVPLIILRTEPVINGRDVARQYFAVLDDRLYFVRMEDGGGKVLRNVYRHPNHTLGGELPAATLTEWLSLLQSPLLPHRLAALTYLAGDHLAPGTPPSDGSRESEEQAEMAAAFQSHAVTARCLAEYRRSPNPWLREAAELASTWDEQTR